MRPLPLGTIVPNVCFQTIDDSTDPPRWRTIATGPETPVAVNRVCTEFNIPGVWIRRSSVDREYITLQDIAR